MCSDLQMLVVEDNGRGMSEGVLLNYLRLCDTTSRIPAFPRGAQEPCQGPHFRQLVPNAGGGDMRAASSRSMPLLATCV